MITKPEAHFILLNLQNYRSLVLRDIGQERADDPILAGLNEMIRKLESLIEGGYNHTVSNDTPTAV